MLGGYFILPHPVELDLVRYSGPSMHGPVVSDRTVCMQTRINLNIDQIVRNIVILSL